MSTNQPLVPLYQAIARTIQAIRNCEKSGNSEWLTRHTLRLNRLAREYLPSGSGIDSGTGINLEESTADKLVLNTSFHHMNDNGMYDGWTEHTVNVYGSLSSDFLLRVTGENRNEIKDYLAEVFQHALSVIVNEFGE